jgi:serine/threonine protein kinase
VLIAASFSHPAILPLIGCTPFSHESTIVTPLMENGSVKSVLDKVQKGQKPTWGNITTKMIIPFGVAVGSETSHGPRVIHRDLKPGNILLDANYEPKITDFGLSKTAPRGASRDNSLDKGTPLYEAPELIEGSRYDFAADTFAFGMTMDAVLTGVQWLAGVTSSR